MNSPAIDPLVLAHACQNLLTSNARHYSRESEILIGRVMHPRGLKAIFKRPCTRAQAIAKLERPGSPLDKLNTAFLAKHQALTKAKRAATTLGASHDYVIASPRAYALVAQELSKYENAYVLVD